MYGHFRLNTFEKTCKKGVVTPAASPKFIQILLQKFCNEEDVWSRETMKTWELVCKRQSPQNACYSLSMPQCLKEQTIFSLPLECFFTYDCSFVLHFFKEAGRVLGHCYVLTVNKNKMIFLKTIRTTKADTILKG